MISDDEVVLIIKKANVLVDKHVCPKDRDICLFCMYLMWLTGVYGSDDE